MFQQPISFLQKYYATEYDPIHWLQQFIEFFNVFLRCRKFTVAVFSNDQSSATSRFKRPLVDSSRSKNVPSLLKKVRSQDKEN